MRHAVDTKAVVRESDPALHRGVCGTSSFPSFKSRHCSEKVS
jgi:hypothetical protein